MFNRTQQFTAEITQSERLPEYLRSPKLLM